MLFAYIDPGLGSLIWQTVVAAVVGTFFYINKSRRWVVAKARKIFGRAKAADTTENTAAKVEAKTDVP